MEAQDLVALLQGDKPADAGPAFRLGVIPAGYSGGPAAVQFDGETAAGAKRYKVADHITTLAAGKTVLVAMVRKSGVIIAAWNRP